MRRAGTCTHSHKKAAADCSASYLARAKEAKALKGKEKSLLVRLRSIIGDLSADVNAI